MRVIGSMMSSDVVKGASPNGVSFPPKKYIQETPNHLNLIVCI